MKVDANLDHYTVQLNDRIRWAVLGSDAKLQGSIVARPNELCDVAHLLVCHIDITSY